MNSLSIVEGPLSEVPQYKGNLVLPQSVVANKQPLNKGEQMKHLMPPKKSLIQGTRLCPHNIMGLYWLHESIVV